MQRDLRAAQKQRELTEAEAAQLSAVNQRLAAEKDRLSTATASLQVCSGVQCSAVQPPCVHSWACR